MVAALALACAVVLGGVARVHGEPAALTEATVVERDAAVEIWVRLSRSTRYQSELMDSPWRLVLDFQDTAYRWAARPVPVGIDPVRELRGSQFRVGIARLVIELGQKVVYTIDEDREGLRIVLPRPAVAKPPPAPARPAAVRKPPPAGPLLYGVLMLDNRAHAYIYDPAVRQVQRYAVGDALGDAVIETIGERHVVLRSPSGRVELRVHAAQPAAAPKPAASARPR